MREFQTLTCGLGLGPAADVADCGYLFDLRLYPRCSREAGPLPGETVLCPQHPLSLFAYEPGQRGR